MIVRPPSTLGHAVYFANYLIFPVFGGIALALSETSRAWRTAALLASALASFAIVLSGTRAALAGLMLGALFVAAGRQFRWKWVAGTLAASILLTGFYISPAGGRLQARLHWSREDSLGGAGAESYTTMSRIIPVQTGPSSNCAKHSPMIIRSAS